MTEQAGDDTGETDAESASEAAESTSTDVADEANGEDGADGDVGDRDPEYVKRVAAHDEELADAVEGRISQLEQRVETLEADLEEKSAEVDDMVTRLKRKQADFQNFKKRQKKKRDQLRERATEELVERLLPVRDNLVRAITQGEEADIRPGVESTLEQFDEVLNGENVDVIDPEPGEEVDPQRHEVMLQVDSEEPEDTIAELYQPGYEMGEKVLRAAQVTVSNGAGSEKEDDEPDESSGGGPDESSGGGPDESSGGGPDESSGGGPDGSSGNDENAGRDKAEGDTADGDTAGVGTVDGDTADEAEPESAEGTEDAAVGREN